MTRFFHLLPSKLTFQNHMTTMFTLTILTGLTVHLSTTLHNIYCHHSRLRPLCRKRTEIQSRPIRASHQSFSHRNWRCFSFPCSRGQKVPSPRWFWPLSFPDSLSSCATFHSYLIYEFTMYFGDEYRWGEVVKERRKTFEKDHIVRGAGVALSLRHREGPSPTFQIDFILLDP